MTLQILISQLPREGKTFKGIIPPEKLSLDIPGVSLRDGLSYEIEARLVGKELLVTGRLFLSVQLQCSRCARSFSGDVSVTDYTECIHVEEEDTIDLTQSMREYIIVAFPVKPLCSIGCKGLCPKCGKDLNEEMCTCNEQDVDLRWQLLDSFIPDSKEHS